MVTILCFNICNACIGDIKVEEVFRKKIFMTFGKKLIEQVDLLAAKQERTRSEIIREAVRKYVDNNATDADLD